MNEDSCSPQPGQIVKTKYTFDIFQVSGRQFKRIFIDDISICVCVKTIHNNPDILVFHFLSTDGSFYRYTATDKDITDTFSILSDQTLENNA